MGARRRKVVKIFLISTLVLFGVIVVAVSSAFVYRTFRQDKNSKALVIRTPNGIQEELFVRLGGVEQWVQIRGESRDNPILVILHGGPGFSYAPFTPAFQSWEKYFTVIQWDQRGAGKTFGRDAVRDNASMTIDRMAQDGIELTEFLNKRLRKNKAILFAHSWGTVLGLSMVKQRPDLFHAYVGAGQVVDMPRNEAVSYDLILKRIKAAGDEKAVKTLEDIGPPPYKDLKTWMVKGRLIVMNTPPSPSGRSLPNVFAAALFAPNYSLKDAYNLFAGFNYSCSALYQSMMAYDARRLGSRFDLPIFILQGEDDIQAPTVLVQEFLPQIEAPRKELVLFKGEGHTAVLSSPNLFLEELIRRVRPLASD